MRRIAIALILVLGMVFAGCSDDDVKEDGPKVQLDGGQDTTNPGNEAGTETIDPLEGGAGDGTTSTCNAAKLGKACTADKDCGGGTCLTLSSTKKIGICTCKCTQDDPKTKLVAEDTCPGAPTTNICGSVELSVSGGGSKTENLCLKVCKPKMGSNDCPTGVACHPGSNYSAQLYKVQQYDLAVCLLTGCTKGEDCPVLTGSKCDTTKSNCATGEKCYKTSNTSNEGVCGKAGACDTKSGLCKPHTLGKAGVKIGAACKADTDCGNGMSCLNQFDRVKDGKMKPGGSSCKKDDECCSYTCTTGKCENAPCNTLFRNGYCSISGCRFSKTLTSKKCPTDSYCNSGYISSYCQSKCDMSKASSCRGNSKDVFGDYECRYNLGTGLPALCDFGFGLPCKILKPYSSQNLDCSLFAKDKTNATKMSCRDLKNVATKDKYDVMGFCLDNTASGPVPGTTTPDSGPPKTEAGPPPKKDAGPPPKADAAP